MPLASLNRAYKTASRVSKAPSWEAGSSETGESETALCSSPRSLTNLPNWLRPSSPLGAAHAFTGWGRARGLPAPLAPPGPHVASCNVAWELPPQLYTFIAVCIQRTSQHLLRYKIQLALGKTNANTEKCIPTKSYFFTSEKEKSEYESMWLV